MKIGRPAQRQVSGGPPWWARAIIYGPWLLFLMALLFIVPRFRPSFARLDEQGQLPGLTKLFFAFEWLNASCFYLPAFAVIIAFVLIDEGVVTLLRRRVRGTLWSWLWVAAVALAAMPALYSVVVAILLAVFEIGQTPK